MNNLKKKYEDGMIGETISESDGYYPSQCFTVKQLPGLAGKKVGEKVTLCIECEVRDIQTRENKQYKEEEYTLEFKEGKVEGKKEAVKPSMAVLEKMKKMMEDEDD